MFYVYLLLDPRKSNEPFYVGKGKGSRAYIHGKESVEYNKFKSNVINSIKKEGLAHVVKIISEGLTEQEAFDLEIDIIKKLGRRNIDSDGILTNRTLGGEGASGRPVSDDLKLKLSEKLKGCKGTRNGMKNTVEHNKKISEANLGKPSKLRGVARTEEVKAKISKSNTGKKRSDETKKKLSESHKGKTQSIEANIKRSEKLKGRTISNEHKKFLSESRKGKDNPMYGKQSPMKGKTHSEETKRKISESLKNRNKESLK